MGKIYMSNYLNCLYMWVQSISRKEVGFLKRTRKSQLRDRVTVETRRKLTISDPNKKDLKVHLYESRKIRMIGEVMVHKGEYLPTSTFPGVWMSRKRRTSLTSGSVFPMKGFRYVLCHLSVPRRVPSLRVKTRPKERKKRVGVEKPYFIFPFTKGYSVILFCENLRWI